MILLTTYPEGAVYARAQNGLDRQALRILSTCLFSPRVSATVNAFVSVTVHDYLIGQEQYAIMGSNRSGRRRTQRLKRHRKEMARLTRKLLAQSPEPTVTPTQTTAPANS